MTSLMYIINDITYDVNRHVINDVININMYLILSSSLRLVQRTVRYNVISVIGEGLLRAYN